MLELLPDTDSVLTSEQFGKRDRLLAILASLPGAVIAFSGGVDSAVVAKAAALALGPKAVAVTADSPSVPRAELAAAIDLARVIGIRHATVSTNEFANPAYSANDGSRCYFCKSELYDAILARRADFGEGAVCSGANLDDAGDYRPGLTAAAERDVRHPLQEAGFTKADVRALARFWELPVWDKPASPCLSSRIAPGLAVTPERTLRVERAEAYLKATGLRDCRVRYHEGDLARIEVPLSELGRFAAEPLRSEIAAEFRKLGFKFTTLDLDGFRSGSLNELVPLELRARFAQPVHE